MTATLSMTSLFLSLSLCAKVFQVLLCLEEMNLLEENAVKYASNFW